MVTLKVSRTLIPKLHCHLEAGGFGGKIECKNCNSSKRERDRLTGENVASKSEP